MLPTKCAQIHSNSTEYYLLVTEKHSTSLCSYRHPSNGQTLHTGKASLASIRLITEYNYLLSQLLLFTYRIATGYLGISFQEEISPFLLAFSILYLFIFLIDQEKRIREYLSLYDKNTLEQCDLWQSTVWVSSIRKGKNSQTRSDQGLWNWPTEADKVKVLRGWQAYCHAFTEHFQTVLVSISSPVIPKFNFLSWVLLKTELTFSLNYL